MLEVRTTGRYSSTEWNRNGIRAGLPRFSVSVQSFVGFGDVYIVEATTMDDLGKYDVGLAPAPSSSQTAPSRLSFDVVSPGMALFHSELCAKHISCRWC